MATKPTLVLTYELHADPQRVFDALTQPRHLNKYFTTHATVDLQVGGRYDHGDGESGKFLKVAVPRELVYTSTHSKLGFETEVDIKMVPSFPLGTTRMRIVHKGLDPQKVTPEMFAWLLRRWQFLASALQGYLAGQKPVRFDAWNARQSPVYADRL
jgi:uncharacterized protein YndB with AHSA1/START domain